MLKVPRLSLCCYLQEASTKRERELLHAVAACGAAFQDQRGPVATDRGQKRTKHRAKPIGNSPEFGKYDLYIIILFVRNNMHLLLAG